MASVCMQTPTTTMRLCGGALGDERLQHARARRPPRRSPGPGTLAPSMAAPMRSMTVRAMPKSAQRSCGDPSAGSITSSAPKASARRRRVGEKSAASTGPWPRPFRAAMTARPTGPQPTTRQGWPAAAGRPAPPRARRRRGARSARPARSSSASGTGRQQQLLEHHVLGQRARVRVRVADLLHAGRPDDDRHRADPGPDRQACRRCRARARRSRRRTRGRRRSRPTGRGPGTPTESMRPVKCAKSASACRSDPQMPAASERTTT